ncbi:MAG TPA: rRNA maturation RNase YbeY [Gemmatimonadaceae bacterium]|jgi:probable rRNA maturation factor|nr:rRNA maturation RNase YbeY [Gemmatimonadaceae bacterium]
MSVSVYVNARDVRPALSRARVVSIARATLASERVRDAMLSITFVSNAAIARLNAKHLGHRGATDVISFGFAGAKEGSPVVGDIYIAPAVARANALEQRVPIREELARLVVHGTLHVLGYEHPDGMRTKSQMWKRQERLLARVLKSA